MSVAAEILTRARAANVMIATAESCTGGMVAAALTNLPGASDIFDRGFVTYSNAAKISMLSVDPALLAAYGAVSGEVAAAMAIGALAVSDAAIAISITGVAGPGASDRKPEGLVWFAVASQGRPVQTVRRDFGAVGRTQVRQCARDFALDLLIDALKSLPVN